MKKVTVYTDGACSKNPGPGGWACILVYNGRKLELSGFCPETTNNRMELFAAISALQALKEPCNVILYSDSAYLVNAFEKGWTVSWQLNGWKTSQKQPVENQDLWKMLLDFCKIHRIQWNKVKGHSDNEFNNQCDRMAKAEIIKNINCEQDKSSN